LVATGAGCVT
jgi:hypothetical protein